MSKKCICAIDTLYIGVYYVATRIHVAIDINIFPLSFKNKVHYFPPNFSSPNNKLLHRIIQIYCLLFTVHLDPCPHVFP